MLSNEKIELCHTYCIYADCIVLELQGWAQMQTQKEAVGGGGD